MILAILTFVFSDIDWVIHSYDVDVKMENIGICNWSERMSVEFFGSHHGIIRDIPGTGSSSWLLPQFQIFDIQVDD
jgi:hypothetical protein